MPTLFLLLAVIAAEPNAVAALEGKAHVHYDERGRADVVNFKFGATDEVVRHVAKLTDLRQLFMADPRVTDAGVTHVRNLKKLRKLDLSGTQVSDAGLKALAGLTNLRQLDLSNTTVTDAGLVHLKGLRQLERLYLEDTNVTIAGLRSIHIQRTVYVHINVSADRVSEAEAAKFERLGPRVSVYRAERTDYARNVRVAAATLAKFHHSQRKLDTELSRRWFDNFLADLDPQRRYFTRADVEKFTAARDRLGEFVEKKDISLPLAMRNTLLRRTAQGTAWAEEFAAAEHDFTVDEEHWLRYDDFAANEDELRERWRKRVKLELLETNGDNLARADAIEKLARRYQRIRLQSLDDEELFERYIAALSRAYDPHSGYLGDRTLTQFRQ